MTPFFSIIVPTYNRANLLKKCIESVLAQVFEDWELLIIDDGSTDTTKALVKGFGDDRIRYVYQQKSERSQARNRGIDLAMAKYLCFMDDDDYVLPEFLISFFNIIDKLERPTILRTGFYYEFGQKRKTGTLFNPKKYKNSVQFALKEMCGVWSLCIPKSFLQEDRFPDFPHWQDTHLILRLLAKYPFLQLPNYQYIYVQHEQMGTQKIFQSDKMIENRLQLNLAAIDHFFDHHEATIAHLASKDTQLRLVTGKRLHYAISAAKHGYKRKAKTLLIQSLQQAYFVAHWKLYLVFLKYYLK